MFTVDTIHSRFNQRIVSTFFFLVFPSEKKIAITILLYFVLNGNLVNSKTFEPLNTILSEIFVLTFWLVFYFHLASSRPKQK